MSEPQVVTERELQTRFNALVDEALQLNYLVRDTELQQQKVVELREFRLIIKQVKKQLIDREEEEMANAFFHFQCILNCLGSLLQMWIELKLDHPAEAWVSLVDAQEYVSVALRIPTRGNWGTRDLAQHVEAIEGVVFPPPAFLSPGLIEDSGDCSICLRRYSDCREHLEGYIYCGRLCQRINRKIRELHHGALVETPKDKRCIIRYISTEGGWKKDYLTWKLQGERFELAGENSKALTTDGVLLTLRGLDFD